MQFREWGRASRPHPFSGFMSDLWLPTDSGRDCDEGDNIIKQLTVSGTIVRVSCFALFHRVTHPVRGNEHSIMSQRRNPAEGGEWLP